MTAVSLHVPERSGKRQSKLYFHVRFQIPLFITSVSNHDARSCFLVHQEENRGKRHFYGIASAVSPCEVLSSTTTSPKLTLRLPLFTGREYFRKTFSNNLIPYLHVHFFACPKKRTKETARRSNRFSVLTAPFHGNFKHPFSHHRMNFLFREMPCSPGDSSRR